MSFAPPPDQSKVYIAAIIGASIGLAIHLLRTNRLPHVGDHSHFLPHGGSYIDGNKAVSYCGPGVPKPTAHEHWPIIAIILLTVAVACSDFVYRRRRPTCHHHSH
ncbi:TGB2 [Rehmannia allexivirus]